MPLSWARFSAVCRVVPAEAALGHLRLAGQAVGEHRVLGVGQAVAAALREPADRLDARADEDVTLAGLDRVERLPGRLQRGGAVPRDRRTGDVIESEQDGDDATDVVALLAARQPAAHDDVLDGVRVE
jgi:hypothetical protein